MQTLTFKVSDEEANQIRNLARKENLTVSEFLRRRASGLGSPISAPAKVRCEFTGAEIFAPLHGRPQLTTESVREMLTEFP
jgi:hypothetical protein